MKKVKRFTSGKFSFNDYLHTASQFRKEGENSGFEKFLEEDWNNTSHTGDNKERLSLVLQKLHNQIHTGISFYERFTRVAAILVLPALLTIGILSYLLVKNVGTTEAWAEIHSPAGARTQFQLPDGSTGWLNSSSTIRYPLSFSKREVEITGEVLFDVVHQNSSVFKVVTPYFDVKVLGTKFDVVAYQDEETAEVILERGKVQVLDKNNKLWGELSPDEHFVYNKTTKHSVKEIIDSENYTNWTNGILIFKNEPMNEIARRLERKYNAEIILDSDSLKSLIFRASFQDESLDEICKMISEVAPVKYKIFKRKKQKDDSLSKRRVEIWLDN